jgi:hypothetical protein
LSPRPVLLRGAAAGFAAFVALAASSTARAQFPGDIPRSIGETPISGGVEVAQKSPYWGAGAPRQFIAAAFDLGVINLRETVMVGYGKPHWRWFGVEGYSSISTAGGLEYVGVHASLPHIELRTGVRYAFDLQQYFLPPEPTYFRDDVLRQLGPKQRYLAGETEIVFSIPLPHSAVFGVATAGYLADVPNGFYVFEDTLHQIFKPPWYLRGRAGYFYAFGIDEGIRFGAAAEAIYNPGRDTSTMRVGPVFGLTLSHHLDASASFMVTTASNDALGLLGGEFSTIGLRYRWATGDRWPEFP